MPLMDRVRASGAALMGKPVTLPPPPVRPGGGAVLTAAGIKIQPSVAPDQLRALSATHARWQSQAWGYRELIPELRYALQFRARALSRVRFFAAQANPDPTDDEPIALSLRLSDDKDKASRVTVSPALAEAAEEELARLPLDAGFSFLGRWSENFDVAGEAWLHGFLDANTGQETWKIRSTSEIQVSADARQVTLKDPALLGAQRQLDLGRPAHGTTPAVPGAEELYRLWIEHPEKSHEADSSLRSMQSVLEDIVLAGRELRAASRSRIAANGLLLVSRGLTLPLGNRDDTEAPDDTKMARDLQLSLVTPIQNEGDAGQIAPIMITGEIADLEAVRHIRLEREDSPQLLEKQQAGLTRMGNGLDIPPEVITGMADANHWSAWQIDSSTARHHLEPSARIMVDSLTSAYLRNALLSRGFGYEEVRQVLVWYDLGGLTENPNRRQDAIDARKSGDIGPAALRKALGFNNEDAPTPEEQLYMIAMSAGMDQATATAIMVAFAKHQADGALEIEVPDVAAAIAASSPGAATPEGEPAPVGPGDAPGGPPDTAPSAIAASGHGSALTAKVSGKGLSGRDVSIIHSGFTAAADVPAYRLALDDARVLMETDRAVRAQVHAAAEAALVRVLERAGARLRSKATADRELSLTLKGADPFTVLHTVGRTRAFALGGTDEHLLADAFRELEEVFVNLVTLGISAIVDLVLRMLGLKRDSGPGKKVAARMTSRMSARVDEGWASLHATLLDRAREKMFGDGPPESDEGELMDGAVPAYAVRAALAIVGGLSEETGGLDELGRSVDGEPVGGLANGDTVTREIEEAGGVSVGYTWVYGITPLKRKFDPHFDLEGKRFTEWSDPILDTVDNYAGRYAWVGPHFRPGDHGGCMCDYVPGYALPAYADQVDQRLRIPTKGMAEVIMLAEGDDRAGRKGTDAQAKRDVWNDIQKLQARFIKGGAA